VSEARKCAKCNGEIIRAEFLKNLPKVVVFSTEGQRRLDKTFSLCCKKCGFLEIYREMEKSKE
jgi:hypothetical protein